MLGRWVYSQHTKQATEYAEVYSRRNCASWLGHSKKVADAHHRQTLESHFQRATQKPPVKSGTAESDAQAVQNQGQQADEKMQVVA